MIAEGNARAGGGVSLGVDLGTTTLGGILIGPGGETLARAQTTNPQVALGSDVIHRLEMALDGADERLQALLVEGIEKLLRALLDQSGLQRAQIRQAAAAGNPAICTLLNRLSPRQILFPPHRPAETFGFSISPVALGLDLPVALYLFPLLSGYVGGDLVAFLHGLGDCAPGTFCLDIGTNGEMALFTGERWWCTSVATGPAFEGGGISCGMRAEAGAVAGVEMEGDFLRLQVLGEGRTPRGLCGSGLVDTVAAALCGGLIDRRGSIVPADEIPSNVARYVQEDSQGRFLRLYRDANTDLQLTQKDIRAFQLAKGAVLAGAECLLARADFSSEEVSEVIVTGAFGFSLKAKSLKRVALLPSGMVEKVRFVPDGALLGVRRFLMDPQGMERIRSLIRRMRPYPLSGTPAFESAYLNALDF